MCLSFLPRLPQILQIIGDETPILSRIVTDTCDVKNEHLVFILFMLLHIP